MTPPLDCRALVELVTDYLEGALEEPAARRFERHLARCERCRVYVDQVGTTLRALGSIPPEATGTVAGQTECVLLDMFRDWSADRSA